MPDSNSTLAAMLSLTHARTNPETCGCTKLNVHWLPSGVRVGRPFCHKVKGILFCSSPRPSLWGLGKAKKGKFTVLLCMNKHNKSAAGLKGRMTRRFFLFLFVYSSHCIFHHLFALSLLSYPALANPPPLSIHKASSYLFTRFLTAFLLLLFQCALSAAAADPPGWKTLQSFTLQEGDTWKPRPLSVPRRDQEELVCSFVFPLFCSCPSLHPALLPSFCPCLLSREEGGRQVPACISTPDWEQKNNDELKK